MLLFIIIIDPLELHSNEKTQKIVIIEFFFISILSFLDHFLLIPLYSLIPTYLIIYQTKMNFLLLSRESLWFVFYTHCHMYALFYVFRLPMIRMNAFCVYVDTCLKKFPFIWKIQKPHHLKARCRVNAHSTERLFYIPSLWKINLIPTKSSLMGTFKKWEGWMKFYNFIEIFGMNFIGIEFSGHRNGNLTIKLKNLVFSVVAITSKSVQTDAVDKNPTLSNPLNTIPSYFSLHIFFSFSKKPKYFCKSSAWIFNTFPKRHNFTAFTWTHIQQFQNKIKHKKKKRQKKSFLSKIFPCQIDKMNWRD